ncbi:hypothetical protein VM57_19535 [Stenotrophomonas maltophilia]|uniref:Uncharacterized protein n=1 Tax=Stenotrophomonas maltophilia TaxID=40324 RepID=A0A0F5ZP96_STEMA|nr:hypothetical protein VM57_19535 [Stenotrophomonas maltophilia]
MAMEASTNAFGRRPCHVCVGRPGCDVGCMLRRFVFVCGIGQRFLADPVQCRLIGLMQVLEGDGILVGSSHPQAICIGALDRALVSGFVQLQDVKCPAHASRSRVSSASSS